jgi:hypothetical protein
MYGFPYKIRLDVLMVVSRALSILPKVESIYLLHARAYVWVWLARETMPTPHEFATSMLVTRNPSSLVRCLSITSSSWKG